MCQVDNFLKIYYNLEYEDKVTVKRATEIVINIRIWSAFLTFIYLFLVPENAMCQKFISPICITLKPSYYIWNMVFHALLYGICIFVHCYLVKKVLKLQSTIAPVVNLPVQCQIGDQPDNVTRDAQEKQGPSTQNNIDSVERTQIATVSYSVGHGKKSSVST